MSTYITINDIGWGFYSAWAGPIYKGQYNYSLPPNPDFGDKALAVVSATEGNYDSVNMYDSCIVSIGIIQLCEARYFNATKLLGCVADALGPVAVTGRLSDALESSNASFKNDGKGWKFYLNDTGEAVDTVEKQRALYLKCSGKRDDWSDETKLHAKKWCVGLANIWRDPQTQSIQRSYIKSVLMDFVTTDVKKAVFDDNSCTNEWVEPIRAAIISFSANSPLTVEKMYKSFAEQTTFDKWSKEWSIGLLKKLTFGPNITIYTIRYNVIRPKIEEIWKIQLPKTAKDLSAADDSPQKISDISLSVEAPQQTASQQPDDTSDQPLKLSVIESIVSFILSLFKK